MKRHFGIMISAALVALMFIGCKPTVKNYRAAYDAALAKREQAAAEQMRPATGLLSDDGPQMRIIDGDTLYVLKARLRLPDGTVPPGRWAVAVSLFKMDTNAKAAAAAVRDRGFDGATYLKASGGRYYTVSGVVSSLDSAAMEARRFDKAFPSYPYVGLPGAPVLINF
ncbi:MULTISPECIES: hypothetical protein [Muribaculaceae]|uniref:hypothetical protein n=1 Tax=Muribaculaceae TaxID=2005473 RepID=UPI0026176237|nr:MULTISPECIES: hypothetical protein [Muribaculaceae]